MKLRDYLSIALIVICTIVLRAPGVSANLPYFYNEDEAHHFNRSVEMIQSGDLNPKYFHKPSLPTYTRLPFILSGFFWEVRKNSIRKIEEIRTRDSFGLAGYNFTSSHPNVVKFARLPSFIFGILLSIFAYLICLEFLKSRSIAIIASALLAISPELITSSSLIAVDMQTAFFSLLVIYFSLKVCEKSNYLHLASLFAGLTISCKYNALPIVFVPLISIVLNKQLDSNKFLSCIFLPIIGFIIGSPYILSELPLFANQFAYEIYHYGIAGHAEHTFEPGLPMASHYANWIYQYVFPSISALLIIPGCFALLYLDLKKAIIILTFPLLFFIMMSLQRAGFTRNLLCILPILAICIAANISFFSKLSSQKYQKLFRTFFCLILLSTSLPIALKAYQTLKKQETRDSAFSYLRNETFGNLAISGETQLPLFSKSLGSEKHFLRTGVKRFNLNDLKPELLFQSGFDLLVTGPEWNNPDNLPVKKLFPGTKTTQRVVNNPEIKVFEIPDLTKKIIDQKLYSEANFNIERFNNLNQIICENPQESENYCWLQNRITKFNLKNIAISGNASKFSISLIKAWENQKVSILVKESEIDLNIANFPLNQAQEVEFEINNQDLLAENGFFIKVALIKSPALYSESKDTRDLGIAFE